MNNEVKNCIEQAERFLVLREHNKNELIDKLKNKKYEQDVIEQAINFLIDCDELNEERYIKAFILSSNRKHPEGKISMLTRLMAKKADKDLSKLLIEHIYTEEYVDSLIENALKKIEKKGKAGNDFQVKQELFKLGFSSSAVRNYFESREEG